MADASRRMKNRARGFASGVLQSDARTRMNLVLLTLFLAIVLLFGGASRSDVLSQAVVRIAAIALIAISIIQIRREEWRQVRMPVLFILAVAAIIALQLIPLPPDLWAALPGRSLYVEALALGGIPTGWRPISLTPDLTLNSLLATLPILAAILALGLIERPYQVLLVPLIITGVIVSSMIGLVQFTSGSLYFYRITNEGSLVGVFANRNHHALLIASTFPILACWASLHHSDQAYRQLRVWVALCVAASLFPLLLITGSRAGLLLGLLAAFIAAFIAVRDGRRAAPIGRKAAVRLRALALVPVVAGAIAVLAAGVLERDEAFRRLFEDPGAGARSNLLPVFQRMAADFFPAGSGYGSFDPIFRTYEPDSHLGPTYLNHAHNDLAQIVIEGGIFALLLLIPFLLWYVWRSWRLWSTRLESTEQLLGRTGSAVALLVLLSSLVDYPLRTPIIAVLMAIACYWMIDRSAKPGGNGA